jgi:hypothetical protein
VRRFANCAELHTLFLHGVGRPGARDHTSTGNPVTNFTVNADWYEANQHLDRDGDGIACEQH